MADTKLSIMNTIDVPDLYKYLLDNTNSKYLEKYYPNNDNMSIDEKVYYYSSANSFKTAWYKIYRKNESRIESFIRGDKKQLYHINFNILVKLFTLGWPQVDIDKFYYKDNESLTLCDYIAIANRLWAVNMYRH